MNDLWDAIVVGGGPAGSAAARRMSTDSAAPPAGARADYFWRAFFRVMRGEASYRRELARWPGLNLAPRVL